MVHVTYFFTKTLTDFGVEILTTLGSLHPAGSVWTTGEEASSLTNPLASDASCLHSRRIKHERELRCVATGIVREPSTLLSC